jgi:hypothetical protein
MRNHPATFRVAASARSRMASGFQAAAEIRLVLCAMHFCSEPAPASLKNVCRHEIIAFALLMGHGSLTKTDNHKKINTSDSRGLETHEAVTPCGADDDGDCRCWCGLHGIYK